MSVAAATGTARAWVSASSANLGPGFDCLGLALGLVDDVTASVVDEPGVRVDVFGHGAGELAGDREHLVVRALHATLELLGVAEPAGLWLRCVNSIPHGRGLGSSAAAVVAGVLLARTLCDAEAELGDAQVLGLATTFEGHPDNASAALLGGATVAWTEPGGPRAVRVPVHRDIVPLLLLPTGRLATRQARAVLPADVAHVDAAANAGRAALLVHALGYEPDLLLAATHDRLHQSQRRCAMPDSIGLLDQLRSDGLPAVVSGAGPALLVLSTRQRQPDDVQRILERIGALTHWQLRSPGVCWDRARAERT